jgi:chromate transporter
VVAGGALLGLYACRNVRTESGAAFEIPDGRRTGFILLVVFAGLLVAALVPGLYESTLGSVAAAFYRAGALVFGGGHVVLPLLEHAVVAPGWISADEFLAGYGAAQAVPGPLFSVAAFLGARLSEHGGVLGATVALLAIFLPGCLVLAGALPYWRTIASRPGAVSGLAGVNAAVVGLLAAALYHPVATTAILSPADFVIAVVAFALLAATRMSVLIVLVGCVLVSMARLAWTGAGG